MVWHLTVTVAWQPLPHAFPQGSKSRHRAKSPQAATPLAQAVPQGPKSAQARKTLDPAAHGRPWPRLAWQTRDSPPAAVTG